MSSSSAKHKYINQSKSLEDDDKGDLSYSTKEDKSKKDKKPDEKDKGDHSTRDDSIKDDKSKKDKKDDRKDKGDKSTRYDSSKDNKSKKDKKHDDKNEKSGRDASTKKDDKNKGDKSTRDDSPKNEKSKKKNNDKKTIIVSTGSGGQVNINESAKSLSITCSGPASAIVVLESSQEEQKEFSAPSKYCGLRNENFDCYANSCLQALFCLAKVRTRIVDNSKCGPFHQDLSALFEEMEIEAGKQMTGWVSPLKLMHHFCSTKPQFRLNQMGDSHEFRTLLIEALHQEAIMTTQVSQTNKSSYLSDMFMGQIECSLFYLLCEHTSLWWSFIWQVQVQIPNSQQVPQQKFTLKDCITEFTASEILNNDSAPICSQCHLRQAAIKYTSIRRAPLYLMVHLKRFAPDGSKICVPVVIDEQLNLAGKDYAIRSVVLHSGNESTHGHNFAMHREGDNQWIVLDDKSINKGLSNSYAKDKLKDSAYVCIYEAIGK